jgi:L-ascorbate metabolism protein UlaG (beta-lactamase superfamily)
VSDRVRWIGHATVLIELGGTRLLTDPVLRPRVAHLRRHAVAPDVPEPIDAILLSHLHRDHADFPSWRRLGDPVAVVPRGAAASLPRRHRARAVELAVGDATEIAGVTVRAVPARHGGRRHPFGLRDLGAVGFVAERSGTRVYFAGDTDLFDAMRDLASPRLDVAMLPVWGWGPALGPGHLDPEGAARAAALLQPRLAIPIHWGTFLPAGLHHRHSLLLRAPGPSFAEHAARLAPGVRVVVLAPGEAIAIGDRATSGAA